MSFEQPGGNTLPSPERIIHELAPVESEFILLGARSGTGQVWRRIRMSPTGTTQTRTMRAGSATYTAEVPVLEPVEDARASSLQGLHDLIVLQEHDQESAVETDERIQNEKSWASYRTHQESAQRRYQERDSALEPGLAAWVERIRLRAAERLVAGAELGVVACSNCRGQGSLTHDCDCGEGERLVSLGVLEGLPGTQTQIEADEVVLGVEAHELTAEGARADCEECSGSNELVSRCVMCGGCGTSRTVHTWSLTSELTGERVEFVLGVLEAIEAGAVLRAQTHSFEKGGRVGVVLELGEFLETQLAALGLSRATSVPTCPRWGVLEWDRLLGPVASGQEFRVETLDSETRWIPVSEIEGAEASETETPKTQTPKTQTPKTETPKTQTQDSAGGLLGALPDPDSVLDGLIAEFSASQHWVPARMESEPEELVEAALRSGIRIDSAGRASGRVYSVGVLEPVDATLNRLVDLAGERGLGIGIASGFIATGEWGPRILLVDAEGEALASLALEPRLDLSLLEAARTLPNLLLNGSAGEESAD